MKELGKQLITELEKVPRNGLTPELKNTIMELVINGNTFSVIDELSQNTLLTYLVIYNANEINNKEIFELLKLWPELARKIDSKFGSLLQQQIKSYPTTKVADVQRWIELGSPINSINEVGETLLHTAFGVGNLELAEYFLSQKLAIDAKTIFDETLFHSSSSCRNPKIWEFLLAQKMSINAQDKLKNTPLHNAIRNKNVPMVQWLEQHGADLELQDIEDNTPLSLALKSYTSDKNNYERKQIAMILSQVQHKKSKERLLDAIEQMRKYGIELHSQDPIKAKIATALANELRMKVESYSRNPSQMDLHKFKIEIYLLLNSKNAEMSKYRLNWAIIIKNIIIALTGIGVLALIGQLVYSTVAQGRPLFFFQKERTTSEEKIAATEKALDFYCSPLTSL